MPAWGTEPRRNGTSARRSNQHRAGNPHADHEAHAQHERVLRPGSSSGPRGTNRRIDANQSISLPPPPPHARTRTDRPQSLDASATAMTPADRASRDGRHSQPSAERSRLENTPDYTPDSRRANKIAQCRGRYRKGAGAMGATARSRNRARKTYRAPRNTKSAAGLEKYTTQPRTACPRCLLGRSSATPPRSPPDGIPDPP